MRNAFILGGAVLLLGASACGDARDPVGPSFGSTAQMCNLTLTSSGTGTLTVDANSTGDRATWTIQNKGTRAVRFKRQTVSKAGAVTAVYSEAWVSFPYSLAAGAQVTPALRFDVGEPGTGSVGMTVAASCGLIVLPAQSVVVSPTPPSGGATGVPFGPSALFTASSTLRQVAPFTLTLNGSLDTTIVRQIDAARANGIRLVPSMTGGSSLKYVTDGKFDLAKWEAKLNTFDTDAIRTAVAGAVADGTIPFANMMDEPNASDWGGVMTHALLDEMSRYMKSIFPTIRTGVVVQWDWQSASAYESVDVIVSQFAMRKGDAGAYRDSAVVSARRQQAGLMLAMNILNGGKQLGPSCPADQTGGPGTSSDDINCSMTSAEIETFGNLLVSEPYACGLSMYAWDGPFMAAADNAAAFDGVSATAARRPAKACQRP